MSEVPLNVLLDHVRTSRPFVDWLQAPDPSGQAWILAGTTIGARLSASKLTAPNRDWLVLRPEESWVSSQLQVKSPDYFAVGPWNHGLLIVGIELKQSGGQPGQQIQAGFPLMAGLLVATASKMDLPSCSLPTLRGMGLGLAARAQSSRDGHASWRLNKAHGGYFPWLGGVHRPSIYLESLIDQIQNHGGPARILVAFG